MTPTGGGLPAAPALPPPSVLRAFGLPSDDPQVLPGGQGTSVRVVDSVLKPVGDGGMDEWVADLLDDLASLRRPEFRLPLHRRGPTGRAVVDGWVCTGLLPGGHRLWGADWRPAVRVARAFASALAEVDRPVPTRPSSCWSTADALAWAEQPAEDPTPTWVGPAAPLVERLAALARPVGMPAQLVHGDLAGNLLWVDGAPPAVIDLSPYRRPAGWATALVVVDAVLWYRADADELVATLHEEERGQLLLRALLFRLMSSELLHRRAAGTPGLRPTDDDLRWEARHAAPLVAAVELELR